MSQWMTGALRGLTVLDADGRVTGIVESTYPLDGCTPEFAVVRVGRFGQRVMVPLDKASRLGDILHVPFARVDLEDAPSMDETRYFDDAVSRSRGYWALVDLDQPARLAPLPLA